MTVAFLSSTDQKLRCSSSHYGVNSLAGLSIWQFQRLLSSATDIVCSCSEKTLGHLPTRCLPSDIFLVEQTAPRDDILVAQRYSDWERRQDAMVQFDFWRKGGKSSIESTNTTFFNAMCSERERNIRLKDYRHAITKKERGISQHNYWEQVYYFGFLSTWYFCAWCQFPRMVKKDTSFEPARRHDMHRVYDTMRNSLFF